jgi:hypothetical protein
MKSYLPENLFLFRIFSDIFTSQFIKPFIGYLSTLNMKNYQPKKPIIFRNCFGHFSSQIYEPLCPLFINGKCEKLSTVKVIVYLSGSSSSFKLQVVVYLSCKW